jgi:hypothetical protein
MSNMISALDASLAKLLNFIFFFRVLSVGDRRHRVGARRVTRKTASKPRRFVATAHFGAHAGVCVCVCVCVCLCMREVG